MEETNIEKYFQRPGDGALYMYALGCKVFPLKQNEKVPAFTGWQEWAENATEQKIKTFADTNQMHNWGVYCGPSKLTVIDLDVKEAENINGFDTLRELEKENGKLNQNTLSVMTPSGGKHIYFGGECKSSVGKNGGLGDGVDTRGEGGYVVAPGSRINGNHYYLTDDSEIAELPTWIPNKLNHKKKNEKIVIEETEQIPEGERNNTLARLAGSMRKNGFTQDAILQALLVMNEEKLDHPLPEEEIEIIARSISRYKPEEAVAASDFLNVPSKDYKARTAADIVPAKIPKRDWIMEKRYVGGFVSVIVSKGGVGKSSLSMLDALAVATGEPITGYDIVKPGPVWVYNTEDPQDELERRMTAISMHHNIPLSKLDNIFLTSGSDVPLILVKKGRDGLVINNAAIDFAVNFIKENKIVLLIVDPFVRTHEVSENDNMEIDKVVWCFQRIIKRTGCAIGIVHHTNKGGERGEMDSARGASAFVNATRIVHTVSVMKEEEAKQFGIQDSRRTWYMRLDNAKANLHAPAMRADWFEKISITIDNGDEVGTMERSQLIDIREQKALEEKKADDRDMLEYLYNFMRIGDTYKLSDLFAQMSTDKKSSHLFKAAHNIRRGVPKLMTYLKDSPSKKEKIFRYICSPRSRDKHWVVCEASGDHEVVEDFLS